MKIAMLGHKAIPSTRGGIETVLTHLCPLLAEYGDTVVCYNRTSDKPEAEFARDIQNGKYKGVTLKKARTLKIRGVAATLASFTAALSAAFSDCDIVHFHAEGPCAAMFLPKLFGKKCVATVHGLDWQREKWGNGLAAKYILHGEKSLVRHADAVIVLSDHAKRYFQDTYGRQTVLIPNGISKPVILGDDIIKARFGLSRDSYICMVARLTEEKGAHYLIEAYKKIKTEKKLVICGAASDTDAYVAFLRRLAGDNGQIVFTGFLSGDTLAQVYSNAYLVCQPSDLEGMSLSLLEAMSYGNAVICSDIPENTAVCGDAAATFQKGDVGDLAAQLTFFLTHPSEVEKLKKCSAQHVLSRFSWQKTAEQTQTLYETVMKGENSDAKRFQ